MFNLILFGPPGSGKGTQSEKLITRYNFKHLSTGDLLRSEIHNQTPLGMEAKNLMDKGHLVPDEVVIGMISSALDSNPDTNGFLFDGFPRTSAQAEALDKLLQLKKTSIAVMLALVGVAVGIVLVNRKPSAAAGGPATSRGPTCRVPPGQRHARLCFLC